LSDFFQKNKDKRKKAFRAKTRSKKLSKVKEAFLYKKTEQTFSETWFNQEKKFELLRALLWIRLFKSNYEVCIIRISRAKTLTR
jgi:hypothetical protein